MRLYTCQFCNLTLFFENTFCVRCGSKLGYWAETDTLGVLEPVLGSRTVFTCWAIPDRRLRRCENSRFDVCNWMVDAEEGENFCTACRYNRVVPDYDSVAGRIGWSKLESAKHRMFVAFHRLGLIRIIERAGKESLGFLFLQDPVGGTPIMTGHAFGAITIAVTETNDVEREQRRHALGEPYRTLLGHFRHESAHYFWDRLIRDRNDFQSFRSVFGDESVDYQTSVQSYYLSGPRSDWRDAFVSAYASMHPWEDFAETWAHYLHMIASLDTAHAYQMTTAPIADKFKASHIKRTIDPIITDNINDLVSIWLPLTTLMNSLNNAVGRDDAYPFVLTTPVVAKLGYIHRLIKDAVTETYSELGT